MDGHHDAAGLVVEAVLGTCVADLFDGLAGDGRDVDVRVGRDLPCYLHKPRAEQGLTGYAAVGVFGHDGVEDGVRDLIGQLVGVALGDRLRREQVLPLLHSLS